MQTKTEHIIGHLDMDAFFAAVEERNNPHWEGLPLAVGADPQNGRGHGIVSTANYAARAYGLHSAQPISQAWRLSEAARQKGLPPVIFTSGSWSAYSRISKNIMSIIKARVSQIEKSGVDEAYFDLTFTGSYQKAATLCQKIKAEIKRQENLTCSTGIGPNKLIAKIASDVNKPNGLVVVMPNQVQNFLDPLPVRAIPGIGPKTEIKLHKNGIKTFKDLQKYTKTHACPPSWRGLGSTTINEHAGPAKSISEQTTFPADTLDPAYIITKVSSVCEDVLARLPGEGFTAYKTLTLTIRFADFITKTRAHTLKTPTASLAVTKQETLKLILPFFDSRENPQHKKIRLIGIRFTNLAKSQAPDL